MSIPIPCFEVDGCVYQAVSSEPDASPLLQFPNIPLALKACEELRHSPCGIHRARVEGAWTWIVLDGAAEAWERTAYEREHGYVAALCWDQNYYRFQRTGAIPAQSANAPVSSDRSGIGESIDPLAQQEYKAVEGTLAVPEPLLAEKVGVLTMIACFFLSIVFPTVYGAVAACGGLGVWLILIVLSIIRLNRARPVVISSSQNTA